MGSGLGEIPNHSPFCFVDGIMLEIYVSEGIPIIVKKSHK